MKGRQIIQAVMKEHRIGEHDFYVSRMAPHMAARRDAILRLFDAGYTKAAIGRFLRCDETTAGYHLKKAGNVPPTSVALSPKRHHAPELI